MNSSTGDFIETDEWLTQNLFSQLRDLNDVSEEAQVVTVVKQDDAFNNNDDDELESRVVVDLENVKLKENPVMIDLIQNNVQNCQQVFHQQIEPAQSPVSSNMSGFANDGGNIWVEKVQEMQLLEMLESQATSTKLNMPNLVKEPIPNINVVFNNINSNPQIIAKEVYKPAKKQIIKCANCNFIFEPFYFKKHVCDFDENHQRITAIQVSTPTPALIPSPESISKRLKRENQIRIRRFFKEELKYDLSTFGTNILNAFNKSNCNKADKVNATQQCNNTGNANNNSTSNKKQDGPHECLLCERKFVHASGLLRHMEKHALDLIPSPNTVGNNKVNNGAQSSHTQASNGLRIVLKCMVCGRIYFEPNSFIMHLYVHFMPDGTDVEFDINPANCELFESRFEEVQELIATVPEGNKDYTPDDDIHFEDFSNVCFKVVVLSNVLQCEFCDMVFSDVVYLFYHSTSHAAEHTFECFACEIQTQTCKEIVTHWQAECVYMRESLKVNNSIALRYYVCNVCEDKYGALELLTEHRYHAHHIMPRQSLKTQKLMLPCEYCNAIHETADEVFTHFMEKHSKKLKREKDVAYGNSNKTRLYLCDICGKSYTQSSHLWQHLRFHKGVKPFGCKIPGCNRKFTIRPDLNDHIRKCHTGERPYHCIVCGKRFLTGSVFYQHRLIHRGERRYECEECGKRFYRADALKNHLRIHTGEKPFGCLFCTKHFRQRGDRDKHIRARHSHLDANTRLMMQMQKMHLERAAVGNNPNANNVANLALGIDDTGNRGGSGGHNANSEENDMFFLGNLPVPKM